MTEEDVRKWFNGGLVVIVLGLVYLWMHGCHVALKKIFCCVSP